MYFLPFAVSVHVNIVDGNEVAFYVLDIFMGPAYEPMVRPLGGSVIQKLRPATVHFQRRSRRGVQCSIENRNGGVRKMLLAGTVFIKQRPAACEVEVCTEGFNNAK